jgi:mannose-6-phosphate isomerase-like protein (cupin superfamily)
VQAPDLSVIEEEMPPGTEEVRHRHLQARQFFYVLHGSLIIECDGVSHQVGTHSGIEVAPMTPHQVRNESDSDVGFLVISQPPVQDDREVV